MGKTWGGLVQFAKTRGLIDTGYQGDHQFRGPDRVVTHMNNRKLRNPVKMIRLGKGSDSALESFLIRTWNNAHPKQKVKASDLGETRH